MGKSLETLDRQYDAIAHQDNNGAFTKAIELMAENDSRDDVRTLYREAARTKTDEDRVIVEKRSTGLRRNRSAGPTRKSRGYGGKFARSRQGESKSSRRGGNSASTAMTTRAPPSATRRRSTMCLAASSKVR